MGRERERSLWKISRFSSRAAIVRRAFRSARVAAFPGGPAPAAPRTEPGTGQAQWAAAGGSPSSGLRRRPSPPGPSEAISSFSGGNGGPQQGHWTSQEQACEGRVWSEVSTGSEATGFEEEEGDSWFYVTCVCGRRQHPRRFAQGFGGQKVRLGVWLVTVGWSKGTEGAGWPGDHWLPLPAPLPPEGEKPVSEHPLPAGTVTEGSSLQRTERP